MAGPAPWVTRPVARLRGAALGPRVAGRDDLLPSLRAPHVHQPRAAARAQAGGAVARRRHAAGPGPSVRPPAAGPGRRGREPRRPALAPRAGAAGQDARAEPG